MEDSTELSKDMVVHGNFVSDNKNNADSELIPYPLPSLPKVSFKDEPEVDFGIPGKEKKANTIHEEVQLNKMKNKLTRGYDEPIIIPPRPQEILLDANKQPQVVIESLNKNLVKDDRL